MSAFSSFESNVETRTIAREATQIAKVFFLRSFDRPCKLILFVKLKPLENAVTGVLNASNFVTLSKANKLRRVNSAYLKCYRKGSSTVLTKSAFPLKLFGTFCTQMKDHNQSRDVNKTIFREKPVY